jgi:murein DD-endopeptidase MepM/ murein hydrolase activator NlpD
VVLAHAGGFDTLYGHLSTALVKVGQVVSQGTPVGLEGSTGNSTGPHLHFELRVNQRPVDPTPYLPPGAPSPYKV